MGDILVKDLKKDQIFYEREMGSYVKCKALEDAEFTGNGYKCNAEVVGGSFYPKVGDIVNYYQDEKTTIYGPHLYHTDYE